MGMPTLELDENDYWETLAHGSTKRILGRPGEERTKPTPFQ